MIYRILHDLAPASLSSFISYYFLLHLPHSATPAFLLTSEHIQFIPNSGPLYLFPLFEMFFLSDLHHLLLIIQISAQISPTHSLVLAILAEVVPYYHFQVTVSCSIYVLIAFNSIWNYIIICVFIVCLPQLECSLQENRDYVCLAHHYIPTT